MSVVKELAIKGGRKSRAVDTFHEACNRFGNIARYDLKHLNVAGAFERLRQLYKRDVAIIGSELDGWRKQALEENAALDIAREQLAAKEAELASVMGDLDKLLKNGDLLCVQKVKLEREIEKRNSLIKELTGALNAYLLEECAFCLKNCEVDDYWCDRQKSRRALVERALEVTK